MSEWIEAPLSELVTFQKGRKVSTSAFPAEGYVAYLGASGIEGNGGNEFATTQFAALAKATDILMLWDGERSGLVGFGKEGVVASTVSRLSSKGYIDPQYLYFYLYDKFEWIQNRRTGTGVPHVPKDIGRILRIRYPQDSKIQSKIATILASIDGTIQKTEALIAKYQQIKTGLMHDLFTRGVLPDGRLRPAREEAPELYQKTVIGWIPQNWDVKCLKDLLAPISNNIRSGPFGSALLKNELVENGIPFLGIDNIHRERFESTFRRFVSENKFLQLSKYKVRPRDVVITIMGTVGRCCVIPENIEVALSSKHLWTMTFNTEEVIPELICWQLNHAAWAQSWFRRAMQGGIMDAIQSSTLKTLRLPVPNLDEQTIIHNKYNTISKQIENMASLLEKLRKQKNGLMQDLLTGKVAVRCAAEDEAVETVA